MLAAAAAWPLGRPLQLGAAESAPAPTPYGTDPRLADKIYRAGELWPLTFTPAQRALATCLCDTIIPADAMSPSASAVGVVDFIDEWISAPYPEQQADRATVLQGFAWLDAESSRRFSKATVALDTQQLHAICDDICYVRKARSGFVDAAKFFMRFRDLTTGGFYTTPAGRKDLRYVGNTPLTHFDGPPLEVLKKAGLA
jgi:hypothetical protein